MNKNCIAYLELAADSNSAELALKHLSTAISFLEGNDITEGDTNIFWYEPANDIGFWYENLKSAQTQLTEYVQKAEQNETEESNILMKLHETLMDTNGMVTHPSLISFYPSHVGWCWTMWLIWILWGFALIFGIAQTAY